MNARVSKRLPPAKVLASRATIYDVAEDAGVSIATVSRFLKGIEPIAAATKRKVAASVARLDYRPSALAASLSSRTRRALGVVLAGAEDEHAEDLFALLPAIARASAPDGYALHVTVLEAASDPRALLERHADLVDGTILVGEQLVAAGSLLHRRHPVVMLEGCAKGIATVRGDQETGARLLARHMLGLGHRRIACLGGRTPLERARLDALSAALQKARVRPAVIRDCNEVRSAVVTAARKLLAAPTRPTAILATSDRTASAVLEAAHALRLRVPDDLSVTGFGDAAFAANAVPALTTVRQPLAEFGKAAVRVLREIIENPGARRSPATLILPMTLIVRASSARPA